MAYYNKSPQNNGDGKNAEDRALFMSLTMH